MNPSKSAKNTESLFSRIFNWSEAHEGWTMLIIALFAITIVLGALNAYSAYSAHCAREKAKTYVGQHTFTEAKWWMFQGRLELFKPNQADGLGLSVPVNTQFGSKINGEFIKLWLNKPKDPKLQFPITVNVTYDPTPQNIWTDNTSTHEELEGAYLRFEIASPPPSVNTIADTRY
jgi:hypothetical protein